MLVFQWATYVMRANRERHISFTDRTGGYPVYTIASWSRYIK